MIPVRPDMPTPGGLIGLPTLSVESPTEDPPKGAATPASAPVPQLTEAGQRRWPCTCGRSYDYLTDLVLHEHSGCPDR